MSVKLSLSGRSASNEAQHCTIRHRAPPSRAESASGCPPQPSSTLSVDSMAWPDSSGLVHLCTKRHDGRAPIQTFRVAAGGIHAGITMGLRGSLHRERQRVGPAHMKGATE
jgi:hypothetical protein